MQIAASCFLDREGKLKFTWRQYEGYSDHVVGIVRIKKGASFCCISTRLPPPLLLLSLSLRTLLSALLHRPARCPHKRPCMSKPRIVRCTVFAVKSGKKFDDLVLAYVITDHSLLCVLLNVVDRKSRELWSQQLDGAIISPCSCVCDSGELRVDVLRLRSHPRPHGDSRWHAATGMRHGRAPGPERWRRPRAAAAAVAVAAGPPRRPEGAGC
jgi:hypothetical protein